MNIFEFLMILLSLIVGLGVTEILSGIARILKRDGIRGFGWTHGAAGLAVFFALLQMFWESWGLRTVETWSFLAMLTMLGGPIFLYLMSHMLFPASEDSASVEDYYFERARLLWPLGGFTVVVATLFRPIAFGDPLWVLDNVSAIPILAVCGLLSVAKSRMLHRVLVPLVLGSVLLDTLTFSHSIA